MPVEIREILINATVDESASTKQNSIDAETMNELIQEAVDRVLEILKSKDEA